MTRSVYKAKQKAYKQFYAQGPPVKPRPSPIDKYILSVHLILNNHEKLHNNKMWK